MTVTGWPKLYADKRTPKNTSKWYTQPDYSGKALKRPLELLEHGRYAQNNPLLQADLIHTTQMTPGTADEKYQRFLAAARPAEQEKFLQIRLLRKDPGLHQSWRRKWRKQKE